MTRLTALAQVSLVLLAGIIGATAILSWHAQIKPVDKANPETFDPALVKRGALLSALGDCSTCHTAPGGKPYAGGMPLPTPFGTIYATNITPDDETGIGTWSLAAFQRAMREGVDREGHQLYPAFPYDHFTQVSDDDNAALFAFLKTRPAVSARAPDNDLPFPLNHRPILAGWNLLFLSKGPFQPNPAQSAEWNRGAYLVEGIGHCGACHSPRNALGAEKRAQAFAGGEAEGWHAFTINAASKSPVPWTVDSLDAYLSAGWHGLHGVARGPMQAVSDNLSQVPAADVHAMAVYVAALMGTPSAQQTTKGDALVAGLPTTGTGSKPQSAGSQTVPLPVTAASDPGAALYANACASCHESGRPVPFGGIKLSLSTSLQAESPRNLIHLIVSGIPANPGLKGPMMPGFGAVLSDQQVAQLATYLRATFSSQPTWTGIESEVAAARKASKLADLAGAPMQIVSTTSR